MPFVKKHFFLILCAVAALVGLGLLVMAMMTESANKDEFDKFKRQIDFVGMLAGRAVGDDELEHIHNIASRINAQVERFKLQASQATARPLVFDQVFPEPVSEPWKFYYRQFANRYCDMVWSFCDRLNAKDRPSDAEIEAHRDDGAAGETSVRQAGPGDSQERKLSEDLFRRRAREISVYACPAAFCCYEQWDSQGWEDAAQEKKFHNSWFTQIAAWIQEDVVQAIGHINQDSKSVADSPIKRLIEISFNGPAFGVSGGGAPYAGRATPTKWTSARSSGAIEPRNSSQLPAYARRDAQATRSTESTRTVESWTQRTSDNNHDIVHFEIAVIIDTTHINDFLNALQSEKTTTISGSDEGGILRRNQITVLEMHLLPFDYQKEREAGYYYGLGSLALLRLPCEYVFFKKGYEHQKPQAVKDLASPRGAASLPGTPRERRPGLGRPRTPPRPRGKR